MAQAIKSEYVHPEVLVDTHDPNSNYTLGHVPGAVLFHWKNDINEPISRNILSRQIYEELSQKA